MNANVNFTDLFYRYFIRLFIIVVPIVNWIEFRSIGYSNKYNIFLVVFINLFVLSCVLSFYLMRILNNSLDEKFIDFLDISSGKLRFTNLMSFLGEQALGSLLATLTVTYGKEILNKTNSGTLAALFVFIMFVSTIIITTLSLGKIIIQLLRLKYSRIIEIPLMILFYLITYWLYIGGLKLASN